MIFDINFKKDKFIEKIYDESMKELNEFFGFNWKNNTPALVIVPDRKTFDVIYKGKTEDWLVSWNTGTQIFVLGRKKFEKESCHKYSDEYYKKLIKHELCHSFCYVLSGNQFRPLWFSEGIAYYLAEQINNKSRPKKFSNFLEFYDKQDKRMYDEGGFVVELLIKKFGETKIINLVKSLKKINSEKDFKKEFKKIYKFDLNYVNINKTYK